MYITKISVGLMFLVSFFSQCNVRKILLIQLQADIDPNVNTRRKHDIENCQCIYVFEVFVKKKVALK